MPLLHHSYEPEKNKLTFQHSPLTTGPINKSLIANFSGKETSFFFKISPKVVFCTTVPEYGHNSICQKTDLTTFVSQVFNSFMRPDDTEMIANICSFERMEAAINEFQPFKEPGPDGLYPVMLQKGWNQLKGYYLVFF